MRHLVVILLASLLAGCGIVRWVPAANRACNLSDSPEWLLLKEPPSNSDALLAIAKPRPPFPGQPIHFFWFKSPNGHIKLCRVAGLPGEALPPNGCGAVLWEFESLESAWRLLPTGGETITICG